MTANREKRSSSEGMAQGSSRQRGVGGRHGSRPGAGRGGGYPDTCTTQGSAVRDPRLAELRAIGLGRHWLRVAEEIGVDNFLATWNILSREDSVLDDCHRVHIPSISTYLRFQRNRFIGTMASEGSTAGEIRQALKKRLGYDLTESYIRQLIRKWKE